MGTQHNSTEVGKVVSIVEQLKASRNISLVIMYEMELLQITRIINKTDSSRVE